MPATKRGLPASALTRMRRRRGRALRVAVQFIASPTCRSRPARSRSRKRFGRDKVGAARKYAACDVLDRPSAASGSKDRCCRGHRDGSPQSAHRETRLRPYCRPWIMVPMAPSSTRMRSRARRQGGSLRRNRNTHRIRRPSVAHWANAQQMADRKLEVRAVHGVEERYRTPVCQFLHCRRRQLPPPACASRRRRRALRTCRRASRHRRARRVTKLRACLKLCIGMMRARPEYRAAGTDAGRGSGSRVVIERTPGDGARRPASTLAFSVSISVSMVGLSDFRDGGNRDFDIGIALLDAFDQVGRA